MPPSIIHDYLNQYGGAEKVLFDMHSIWPDAPVYVLLHDSKRFNAGSMQVHSSFLRFFPCISRLKLYFPLFVLAANTLCPKSDIILSSSHAWVKNIRKPQNSLHICYCYTPMRYAWDLKDQYLEREPAVLKPFIKLFLSYLRHWDKNGSKNVDHFIAISKEVQNRIKKYYDRDSVIIYPPVETKYYSLSTKPRKDYYFLVSRLIEYKKVDLVIEAFRKNKKKLLIAGSGRDEARLKRLAKSHKNISFLGRVSDKRLKTLYQDAKAFLFPQLEDFGITAVEAQACGTPVIAFAKGGALETVIEGKTGHFFKKQTSDSLNKAIAEFEKMSFNPKDCRDNALRFDKQIFKKKIKAFVDEKSMERKLR